ncbi:MAG: hypothetical protein AVDCRST_MAG16-367, partial [uncultured Frankineae bacterium]
GRHRCDRAAHGGVRGPAGAQRHHRSRELLPPRPAGDADRPAPGAARAPGPAAPARPAGLPRPAAPSVRAAVARVTGAL